MSSAERYEPQKNQWEMIPSMQRQRSDASAAALHNKIYIVGGFNGQEVFSSVEVFDVETNQWSYVQSMLNPRSGVSLVAFRDSLYALGGFNGFTRLSSGERYIPNQSDDWQPVTEMFSPRSNFATVILDDMIFVIGGFNGSTTIAYVECYDGDCNEWYDASPMNLNRSALSACVISGLPNAREYSYLGKAQDLGQGWHYVLARANSPFIPPYYANVAPQCRGNLKSSTSSFARTTINETKRFPSHR